MDIFNSQRLTNLLVALGILFAGAGGLLYFALYLLWSFGSDPVDGGVLRPLAERVAWSAAVATTGVALLWGGLLYMYRYVLRVERLDGDRVRVTTPGVLGRHVVEFAPGQLCLGAYHRGRFRHHGTVSVDAPYQTLHAQGRRVPYILDMQAGVRDGKALSRLRCTF